MRTILIPAILLLASSPALAAPPVHHHGTYDPQNYQPPQDPYHFDNYNREPGIDNVTTTSQTLGANGQVTSSSTTSYDRDQFGTDVKNTTLNANGTKTTYDQQIDTARQPAPPAYGTTTRQLPTIPNSGGGYAPNAVFAPSTATTTTGTTTSTNPYYNASNGQISIDNSTVNVQSGGGTYGPANPASSANVTPGFSSHSSYNGN